MADKNRAELMGRLGKDPEVKTFDNGDRVANFSLATGEKWKDKNTGEAKERTEWHQIVVYGPLVDVVEKWLKKGRRVAVEGAIRTRKWQDQSGTDRYTTEIVLSGFNARLDLIDFDDAGNGGADRGRQEAYSDIPGRSGGHSDPARQAPEGYAGSGYSAGGRSDDLGGDDIPFAPEVRG